MSIFGIGTVVVDHVVRLKDYPESDTKQAIEHHWKQVGGPVPVALSTAAFYGAKTAFLSRCGSDPAGRFITETLSARNVDVEFLHSQSDWETGFAHVWSESQTATRTIAYFRGNHAIPDEQTIAEPAVKKAIQHSEILHLDGWAPDAAIAAAKQMKSQGGIVVLDAGSMKPHMDELFPLVDILIASALFRKSCLGDINASVERLLELGCGQVISTHGGNDLFYSIGQEIKKEKIPVVSVVDSNGAGDVFSGAVLHGLASRWEIEKTVAFAIKVASYSCGFDGNSSYPPIKKVS